MNNKPSKKNQKKLLEYLKSVKPNDFIVNIMNSTNGKSNNETPRGK